MHRLPLQRKEVVQHQELGEQADMVVVELTMGARISVGHERG